MCTTTAPSIDTAGPRTAVLWCVDCRVCMFSCSSFDACGSTCSFSVLVTAATQSRTGVLRYWSYQNLLNNKTCRRCRSTWPYVLLLFSSHRPLLRPCACRGAPRRSRSVADVVGTRRNRYRFVRGQRGACRDRHSRNPSLPWCFAVRE